MSDAERITGLINDIYDAALDVRLWPRVLRRAIALLGPSAAVFPDAGLPADQCMQSNTRVPLERTHATLRLLAPHFRCAFAIGKALEHSERKAAELAEVLEQLTAAVVFVDRAGRLVHANALAARMLEANDLLSCNNGRPRPTNERAAAHLRAILAPARQGRPEPQRCALTLTHTLRSGARFTIHVLPLSAGSRRQASTPAAAAAIVLSQQAWDLPQRLQSASRLYSLTPAESRVASALLTGCTIGGAAKALGIKEATVKTHLQHIFDKTGARRQVDLAQRVADCARLSLGGATSGARAASANERTGDA